MLHWLWYLKNSTNKARDKPLGYVCRDSKPQVLGLGFLNEPSDERKQPFRIKTPAQRKGACDTTRGQHSWRHIFVCEDRYSDKGRLIGEGKGI